MILLQICVVITSNASALNLFSDSLKTSYRYEYMYFDMLSRELITSPNGSIDKVNVYIRPYEYNQGTPFIDSLVVNGYYFVPLETIHYDHGNVVDGSITTFYPSGKLMPKEVMALEIPSAGITQTFAYSNYTPYPEPSGWVYGLNPDPHYKVKVTLDKYNDKQQILQKTIIGGTTTSYVMGYNSLYTIAEITNAKEEEVAYTSFEKRSPGTWQFSGVASIDETAPMGTQCYELSGGALSKAGLPVNKIYQLSYWKKAGASININGATVVKTVTGRQLNGWEYVVVQLSVNGTVSLSGSGYIDEVRLHPKDAMMVSYCYRPLFGKISECDTRGNTQYWEYDALQRPKFELDRDKNIVKSYDYHIKN